MSKNILKHIVSGMIMMVLIMPLFLMAQGDPNPTDPASLYLADSSVKTPSPTDTTVTTPAPVKIDIEIKNPFKQDTIPGLINTIISDILIPIGAVVAVMVIMWAGFKYVTAGGDTGKIKEAHDALKYAVIGAAILLGARILSEAIGRTIEQLK